MDYSDYNREQLLERIEELELLNRAFMMEKQKETGQRNSLADCLGRWYWNTKTNTISLDVYSPALIGFDKSEIPDNVSESLLKNFIHPDDYQKKTDAMERYLNGKESVYSAEYRMPSKDGEYRWFYDRGWVQLRDSDGSPLLLEGIVFDITERKKPQLDIEDQNKVLTEMSYIDELTKVINHRAVVDKLTSAMADAGKRNQSLSIALFDIDDFKKVNDTHGHICGDQVLTDVAATLRNCIRDTDFVGRYGGDEFLVVFINADNSVAYHISDRIREAVEQGSYTNEIRVTVSGGVAQYAGENLLDFINASDTNLYEAKKRGKNQIVSNIKFS
jgi:diguanylate cyclase (GGDEF)-like protein/PAS domain S-box-containing protein